MMAIGVLSALAAAGRRVPADVAVVSCDDMPVRRVPDAAADLACGCRWPRPGGRPWSCCCAASPGEPVPEKPPLLPVELIVRDSCGGRPAPVPSHARPSPTDREQRRTSVTRIAVDPARPVGQLDRNVFGGFVEHLGRCIYGGLYDEGSPLATSTASARTCSSLLRELRMGVLRWPGGNFVSNYHWADGIGPEGRPATPARAGLGRRGVQPVRHRRVPGLLRGARHRARTSA